MYYLLLENYNNYENRIIKKFDTVQEYKDDAIAKNHNYVHYTTKDVNFNKRDNITATHIFNDNISPDYLIWIDKTTGNIVSRWFVINYQHTSGGQFLATLKHDSIADNLASVLTSPAFIHKGYVGPSDPATFNKENMGFNQIKTKEGYIQDATRCAYIVGYLATDHTNLTNETFTYDTSGYDIEINTDFENWSLASLCNGTEQTTIDSSNVGNEVRFILEDNLSYREFVYNKENYFDRSTTAPDYWKISGSNIIEQIKSENWFSKFDLSWSDTVSKILLDNPSLISLSDYDTLISYNGKLIKFTDGFYRITVIQDISVQQSDWSYYDSGNLYNYLYNKVNAGLTIYYNSSITQSNLYPVAYKLFEKKFIVQAEKITNVPGTYKYTMNSTSELNLKDAPYKMFVIPYRTVETANYTFNNISLNKELALQWAMDIAKKLGNGIYDLQLLPYFPSAEISTIINYEIINLKHYIRDIEITYDATLTEGVNVVYLKDSNNDPVNFAFFFDYSTFETNAGAHGLDNETIYINISDYKISNECDMIRICSPNYASAFEFNPAKNRGNYSSYKAYCTYKPYNPFIYVTPNFGSLYGGNYKDNRGLILSGDFSLPIVNDAWINYQLNNKNYLLAFDRQIQNMEFNYSWQRREAIANSITGVAQGTTMGALTGASIGGPYGAIAGAVVGAGASTVGGIMDLTRQSQSFSESKDYAYDSFGYQLGNIKALPNTLNKVSSLVATSKLYPVFEYYTCTDEEKQALKDKIKYNGMSIGRIGTISQFLNPEGMTYIKCQLIRNTNIPCSANMLLDIYNELEKGVFIE